MIWLKMLVVMIPTEVPPEGSLAQREGGQWACVYMGFPFPERECSDKCYHRQMLDQSVARDYCSRGATTNHGGGCWKEINKQVIHVALHAIQTLNEVQECGGGC